MKQTVNNLTSRAKQLLLLTSLAILPSVTFAQCPDNNHPHAIDLGLPSGTKWACCNLGANRPEGYGLFFAWGETVGYGSDTSDGHSFDWENYKWCRGDRDALTKYSDGGGNNIVDKKFRLDLKDDAAYVNWGDNWCIPSYDQINELVDNTSGEPMKVINGIKGFLFTSKTNGKYIFIPYAGLRDVEYVNNGGSETYLWMSSIDPYVSRKARVMNIYVGLIRRDGVPRCWGLSVRAVQRK